MKETDEPIGTPLTAEEIRQFDVITNDREGVDRALRVTLTFHANSIATLKDRQRELWLKVLTPRGLTPEEGYMLATCRGEVVLARAPEPAPPENATMLLIKALVERP